MKRKQLLTMAVAAAISLSALSVSAMASQEADPLSFEDAVETAKISMKDFMKSVLPVWTKMTMELIHPPLMMIFLLLSHTARSMTCAKHPRLMTGLTRMQENV